MVEESFVVMSGGVSAAFSSLMVRGGFVMWPLLLCSLITLTVVIERAWVYLSFSIRARRTRRAVEAIYESLAAGHVDDAIARGQQAGPIGAYLADGIQHYQCGLTQALEEAGQQVIAELRKRLFVLDTIVTIAPMLGILGTVTGIIGSFNLLGSDAGADPSLVSTGIAEALITTATGLIVSMCALVPFNVLKAQLMRRVRVLERAGHHCELAYQKGGGK